MGMKLVDWATDKYLTWKTGKNKAQREWEAWYDQNVNYRSVRIKDMFGKFKHIIVVDSEKFMSPYEPFAWVPCKDAQQYFWPARPLGENAVWRFERVINCPATAWEWEVNELGGADTVFVATNSDEDALMLSLKYS